MQPKRKPQGYGTISSSASSASATMSQQDGEAAAKPGVSNPDTGSMPAQTTRQTTRWTPIVVMLVMLGVDSLSYVMCMAPQTQLFENIACRKYYSHAQGTRDFGGEERCKAPEVQDTVAQLFGWQAFFDGIPGLLLAMYYGVMADKHGRRPVMVLSKIGQLLAMCWVLFICWVELPLRLMWLSSLFTIIGGGGTVASAVCMMVLTDSTTEQNRSRVLFQTNAVLIVSELLGPPLSTLMMQNSLWLPLIFALLCTVFTTALSALIPETLPPKAKDNSSSDDSPDDDSIRSLGGKTLVTPLSGVWKHASGTLSYIFRNKSVLFLVISFLVVDYSRQSLTILLQYISTRYSISIAKANLLISCKSLAQLITCAILLPALDSFVVQRLAYTAKQKDLRLARMSISLLMLSFAVLVVAPGLWVVIIGLSMYTLGTGFGAFARSLVSSLVEPRMTGTLFTTLAIMDTVGSIIAGPVVAGTFSWSLRFQGIWRGMPYVFSFVLCGLATLALARVKLADQQPSQNPRGDEECRPFMDEETSAD